MEDREVFINTGAKNSQFNISYIDGMPDAFCGRPKVTIKFVNIINGLELINEDLKGIYLLHKHLEKIYSSGMNEVMAEEASKHHFLTDTYMDFDFEHVSLSYVLCGDNWDYNNLDIINVSIVDMIERFNSFYEAVIIVLRSEQIIENN